MLIYAIIFTMLEKQLLPNNRIIFQDKSRFCFGVDAVLLSNFARENFSFKKNVKICDLCTGNAIVPLLLSDLECGFEIFGVEIQKESFEIAQKSVEENDLTDKIKLLNLDLNDCISVLKKNSFDFVTVNPPYMKKGEGRENPNDAKNIARREISCTLDDVVRVSAELLKSPGTLFMIHKPERLSEIFASLQKYKLEPKKIRLVFPSPEKNATMVLVEARKGAKGGMIVENPIFVS